MHIGVPKEIKNHEYRVGLTPSSVREMVAHGHVVSVETGAGAGIGAADAVYEKAGATIAATAAEIFAKAEMIIKVKEPQAGERAMLREGQILYTYLHLAPDPAQCADLVSSGAVCIAYETVTQPGGGLPLLAPMSEVAGRLSIQAGAYCLEKAHGGMGILLGGVAGVPSAKIVILGAGVVGSNAAQIAVGTGAQVVVIDRSLDVLRRLDRQLGARVITVFSNRDNVEQHVLNADLVIGGVLIPGAAAPKLITRDLVNEMRPGSVIVDVAIDQGAAARPPRRRRTPTRPTLSAMWCTTASPTCRAAFPTPPPMRSTMRPCRSRCRLPTRVGGRRCRITSTCATVSTSLLARSPAAKSPTTSSTRIMTRYR
jgi:alanine dehydrogenase